MAFSHITPLVMPEVIRSGDDTDEDDLYDAYAAAQTIYEEVIAPLVCDVQVFEESTQTLAVGDLLRYQLPRPRNELSSAAIDTPILVAVIAEVDTDPAEITVGGETITVDATTPTYYEVEFDVADDSTFDLEFEVTSITDELRVFAVYVCAARDRTVLPTRPLDNGAAHVDLAEVDADKPLTTWRHNDVLSLLRVTHEQQYRVALASASWYPTETITADDTLYTLRLEVPDSLSLRAATLTFRVMMADVLGYVDISVNGGATQRISCALGETWYSLAFDVDLPPPGVSRPYGIPCTVQASVDVSLIGIVAHWSEVPP